MVRKRISKVWADERRRLSNRRKAPAPPVQEVTREADDDSRDYDADIEALTRLVNMQEAAVPQKTDPAYDLVVRTWERRHSETRSGVHTSLGGLFAANKYLSCYRVV